MAKVSELLKARRSSPKNSVTNPDLAMLWRDLVSKRHECYVPELTLKQRGQLKLIESALATAAGQIGPTGGMSSSMALNEPPAGLQDRLAPSVAFKVIVRQWGEFAVRTEYEAGLKNVPYQPNVGFLLAHIGVAINVVLDHTAPPKLPPPPKPPIASPQLSPETVASYVKAPGGKKLTLEEQADAKVEYEAWLAANPKAAKYM